MNGNGAKMYNINIHLLSYCLTANGTGSFTKCEIHVQYILIVQSLTLHVHVHVIHVYAPIHSFCSQK